MSVAARVWAAAPLGAVATIERSSVQPSAIPPGTIYVGLENVEPGGRFVGVRPLAAGDIASSKFRFTQQHILYGKLRPYLAKIAMPDFAGVCSTDILPIRPGPDVTKRYLFHFLRQPEVVALASSRASGANLPRLSPSTLAEFSIPLPPLAEQRRIADTLDRAETLSAKRRLSLIMLDDLVSAMFVDMFGDPLSNSKGLPRRRIGDIGAVITGNTPARARPDYYGDAIEWVKSDNLNGPDYFVTTAAEGLSEAGRKVGRWVPKNAILVTCIAGSPDSIGNAGLTDREVAFNQQINALVPTAGNPHFIYGQIRVAKALIQQASTKAMKGLVSKSRFANVELIFPPLPAQDRFAQRALEVEATRRVCRASLQKSNALFASLQQRAFRGEL